VLLMNGRQRGIDYCISKKRMLRLETSNGRF